MLRKQPKNLTLCAWVDFVFFLFLHGSTLKKKDRWFIVLKTPHLALETQTWQPLIYTNSDCKEWQ